MVWKFSSQLLWENEYFPVKGAPYNQTGNGKLFKGVKYYLAQLWIQLLAVIRKTIRKRTPAPSCINTFSNIFYCYYDIIYRERKSTKNVSLGRHYLVSFLVEFENPLHQHYYRISSLIFHFYPMIFFLYDKFKFIHKKVTFDTLKEKTK